MTSLTSELRAVLPFYDQVLTTQRFYAVYSHAQTKSVSALEYRRTTALRNDVTCQSGLLRPA